MENPKNNKDTEKYYSIQGNSYNDPEPVAPNKRYSMSKILQNPLSNPPPHTQQQKKKRPTWMSWIFPLTNNLLPAHPTCLTDSPYHILLSLSVNPPYVGYCRLLRLWSITWSMGSISMVTFHCFFQNLFPFLQNQAIEHTNKKGIFRCVYLVLSFRPGVTELYVSVGKVTVY